MNWEELDESELRAVIHQQFAEIRAGRAMEMPVQFMDDRLDIINTARDYLAKLNPYIACNSCSVSLRRCDKIFMCCRNCDHSPLADAA